MSILDLFALSMTAAGLYLLVVRHDSSRNFRLGSLSIPRMRLTGAILSAGGLLTMMIVGTQPEIWWSWKDTVLSDATPPSETSIIFLWEQHLPFRICSAISVFAAACVVVSETRQLHNRALIVFLLSTGVLFCVAVDWVGAGLCAAGVVFLALRKSRLSTTCFQIERSDAPEPLLAIVVCVLLIWGLAHWLHYSSVNEAGPAIASTSDRPALPRAVRKEVRRANTERSANEDLKHREFWLIGISASIVLAAGLVRLPQKGGEKLLGAYDPPADANSDTGAES